MFKGLVFLLKFSFPVQMLPAPNPVTGAVALASQSCPRMWDPEAWLCPPCSVSS